MPVSPHDAESGPPPVEEEPFGPSAGFASAHEAPDADVSELPKSSERVEDEQGDEVEEAGQRAVPIP